MSFAEQIDTLFYRSQARGVFLSSLNDVRHILVFPGRIFFPDSNEDDSDGARERDESIRARFAEEM